MPATDTLARRLRALNTEAQAFIPPGRPDQLVRQWLGRSRLAGDDRAWNRARDLAVDLALITPSMLGVTALDRLARAMKGRPDHDAAVVAMLRASRPMMLATGANGTSDVVTGEAVTLACEHPKGLLFGRFATLPDGRLLDLGPVLSLGPDPGYGPDLLGPTGKAARITARMVETIYRDIAQSGAAVDPFDPDNDRIDRLAATWAGRDRDPTPDEQAHARSMASVDTLVDTLVRVSMARELNRSSLANAYRWIAAVMTETLALRHANGSATGALDRVERTLRGRIDGGLLPPETLTLFTTLRNGVRRADAPQAAADGDLDKLVARIQALRAKTVEQGCTEQEAMAAAEKVAELLDRYGLSLSELDLRKQACEGIGVETGRKRRGPIDDCMGTIALFFDCRVWSETDTDGMLRYVFFGMPADVQAAVYLHDLVGVAFATETATFQAGPLYARTPSGDRRNATTSFQAGLARGINQKLRTLREERDRAVTPNGTGRALVPVKESIIDQELARLGLTLRKRTGGRRYIQKEAYSAGQQAGARFEYRAGIERPATG